VCWSTTFVCRRGKCIEHLAVEVETCGVDVKVEKKIKVVSQWCCQVGNDYFVQMEGRIVLIRIDVP
jgi:hypothetical protein